MAGDVFVSTEKLFPLLVSSQLPKDVLRELWTLVNKTTPGKLTQLELCILLGLIGLVQVLNGTVFCAHVYVCVGVWVSVCVCVGVWVSVCVGVWVCVGVGMIGVYMSLFAYIY